MTNEELNTQLYQKMFYEQEQFRDLCMAAGRLSRTWRNAHRHPCESDIREECQRQRLSQRSREDLIGGRTVLS